MSPAEAARRHDLHAHDLDDAVETYHAAGTTALYDRAADNDWWQAHLHFTDWNHAEHIATTHLAPQLRTWTDDGLLANWWFIRKAPCWRLRLRPATDPDTLVSAATPCFDQLVHQGHLATWRPTLYEPESGAFGGPAGITEAHTLFSADSTHLLDYLAHDEQPLGRCELSMLLCTTLFRGAAQEWFETGDIWQRVLHLRPDPHHTNSDTTRHTALTRQLAILLHYDTHPDGPLFDSHSPFAAIRPWTKAFHHTGQALAHAANRAHLNRGLRATLAHHVIFHWNRLGLHATIQHTLAHACVNAVFHDKPAEKTPTRPLAPANISGMPFQ